MDIMTKHLIPTSLINRDTLIPNCIRANNNLRKAANVSFITIHCMTDSGDIHFLAERRLPV